MEKFQFVAYVLGAVLSGWGIGALWHVASDNYYERQRRKLNGYPCGADCQGCCSAESGCYYVNRGYEDEQ